jgi:hypothetical protein
LEKMFCFAEKNPEWMELSFENRQLIGIAVG